MADKEDHLARLTSVRSELKGGVVVAALKDEGIPATMSGVYTTGFRAEAPGWVEVYVAEQDLLRAQKILAEVEHAHAHIDWSQVDVGEPEEE